MASVDGVLENIVKLHDCKFLESAEATEKSEKDKPSSSNQKVNYESVVSVVFDGQLISTVKCLTCQHLSHTNETFQVCFKILAF